MPVIRHAKDSVSDKPWNADENVKLLRDNESQHYYETMFLWREDGAGTDISKYKFPFHFVASDGDIMEASLKAAAAVVASLNDGRNKPDIPDDDIEGVYREAVKVYKAAGIDPKDIPDLKTNAAQTGTVYLTGTLEVLSQINDQDFSVKLRVMRDGPNRNKWDFQNIADHYKTFVGRWILCAYVGNKIGDGHNMRETYDRETGEKYFTFTDATAERIVGAISENPDDVTLVEEGGHTWVEAIGRISKFYAPELVDKIVRTGRLNLSAEIDPVEVHMDGDIEVHTVWCGVGVTVLGDGVAPAIPGASLKARAALEKEFKNLKLKAASLQNPQPPQEPQKPPAKSSVEGVKLKLNKNLAEQMQPKFPEHQIIGLSDDSRHVLLLSKDGAAVYSYTFRDEDKGAVVPALMKPATLSVNLGADDAKATVDLALDALTAPHTAKVAALSHDLAEEKKKSAAAEETVKTLKAVEHAFRVQSVKDAVKACAADIKETASDPEKPLCDAAEKAICECAEKYAALEDGDGKFCGDAKACADLKVNFMDESVKLKKAANTGKFVFEPKNGGGQKLTGVDAELAYLRS